MPFAILLALTGLTLSAVAIYYSVIGLTAIFAAAFWPVVVMGATLEIAKLVAASWLKMYWEKIPRGMKVYMTTSVIVLMFITSMGIFGFLSKAHTDQNLVSGDVQSQIALFDEKIKIERENIANAQQVIKQMDAAVNGVIATGDQEIKQRDGSIRIQSAAERSLQIRRSQAKDRGDLTKQIEQSQNRIVKLQEESAPIRAEVRKVEAEVGPIKYIAKLIYGDNPDANLLEKAVVWVIMIIVFVFDPMAVLLLLGAQMTWQWTKQRREEELAATPAYTYDTFERPTKEELDEIGPEPVDTGYVHGPWPFTVQDDTKYEKDDGPLTDDQIDQIKDAVKELTPEEEAERSAIEEWNRMIEAAEEEVEKESSEKAARHKWKEDHPNDTIKRQERLKEVGLIETLPWEIAKDAAEPTYQIFPELQTETQQVLEPDFPKQDRIKPDLTEVIEPDGSKKKNYIVKQDEHQIKKTRS
jgi:translation initiation factor 2B subunit (eIF-2B alpha/beta/delta family)